jgi:hypothetical protein
MTGHNYARTWRNGGATREADPVCEHDAEDHEFVSIPSTARDDGTVGLALVVVTLFVAT